MIELQHCTLFFLSSIAINFAVADTKSGTTIINTNTSVASAPNGSRDRMANQIQEKLANLQCKPPAKRTDCNISDNFKYATLTSVMAFGKNKFATMHSPSDIDFNPQIGAIIEGYRLYSINSNELIFDRTASCKNCNCSEIKIKRGYFGNYSLSNMLESPTVIDNEPSNQSAYPRDQNVPPIIINRY